MEIDNNIEGKLLGKQVAYPTAYAPQLLVAVPRYLNRAQYGIDNPETLFAGYDVWHGYECSFLTNNGLPISGVIKMVYSCLSEFLVESKSLKLYLNSFNMEMLGDTKQQAIENFLQTATTDIGKCVGTTVSLSFFEQADWAKNPFEHYPILENAPLVETLKFDTFREDPSLLKGDKMEIDNSDNFATHLLRSNCKITNQPDWGSLYLHYAGKYKIDHLSVLKYIVSFRAENHFHEEVCEMIYKRFFDLFAPTELMVCCIYTRRGGLDITPIRANKSSLLANLLVDNTVLVEKLLRC